MSRELLDKAKAVIQMAAKRGAGGVRASVSRKRTSSVEWRDGKIDRLRESTQMKLSVALYVDSRYSVNTTNDLRPEGIEKFLDDTIAATRVLAKDPHRKLPDPERYRGMSQGDLGIFDGASSPGAKDRLKVVKALEEAARSVKESSLIVSVSTTCSDSLSEVAMATSNGMEGALRSTIFSIVAETSVRDKGGRRPEGYAFASRRFLTDLPAVESVGIEAVTRALRSIGAKPEKSGLYPCVIENRVAGRLLDGLLDEPLSGRAIQQRQSFLAEMIDKPITSSVLTVTDEPLFRGGLSSMVFDREGMATVKRDVIDKGTLKLHYLDTYYASKLGRAATTDSSTNLLFAAGTKDLDGLLGAMGSGIFVTDFCGGNSNAATGDFSIGLSGMWIEGGKPARPVTEMNMAGNHLTLWRKLVEVGCDPFRDSSLRVPSLRFDKVQFSGV